MNTSTAGGALTIALYNRFFDRWPDLPESCPVACRFTTERAAVAGADAVVFHVPTLRDRDPLPSKGPGQLWVAWSSESRVMCPRLSDPAFIDRCDITMTYERASDVWCPYFGPETASALGAGPNRPSAAAPIVYLQANPRDRCGRLAYTAELMRRVRVDSFGSVHRNRPEVIPPGSAARIDLYRHYKFTLAFENSFAPDYVTEKLYEPLMAGSVPVYRGCPEVAELAPAPDSYVDASEFASAADLGAYLDHLDRHDDEYARFQGWRNRGVRASFQGGVDRVREPAFCRLARVVAARQARRNHAVG